MKKPRFLMLQVYTREILSFSHIAFEVNMDYCLKHGYDFRVADVATVVASNIHPSWGKIYELLNDMHTPPAYDYIFVLDSDAFVVNPDVKLEDIVATDPNAIMFASENGENGGSRINCGSFIAKNSKESAEFFKTAFNSGIKTPKRTERFWEQCIINEMYDKDPALQKLIKILPMRAINSWWKDSYKDCPFIWHFMARTTEQKNSEAIRYYFDVYIQRRLAVLSALAEASKQVVAPK